MCWISRCLVSSISVSSRDWSRIITTIPSIGAVKTVEAFWMKEFNNIPSPELGEANNLKSVVSYVQWCHIMFWHVPFLHSSNILTSHWSIHQANLQFQRHQCDGRGRIKKSLSSPRGPGESRCRLSFEFENNGQDDLRPHLLRISCRPTQLMSSKTRASLILLCNQWLVGGLGCLLWRASPFVSGEPELFCRDIP